MSKKENTLKYYGYKKIGKPNKKTTGFFLHVSGNVAYLNTFDLSKYYRDILTNNPFKHYMGRYLKEEIRCSVFLYTKTENLPNERLKVIQEARNYKKEGYIVFTNAPEEKELTLFKFLGGVY